MECRLCETIMYPGDTGEPILRFENHIICSSCYISIIPEIYTRAGYGDGGMIHLIFTKCLSSRHNRKKKHKVGNYRKLLDKLLHKYHFKCIHCYSKENLTIDHIHPIALGGNDDIDNLQILCKSCNSKKGTKI